MQHVVSDANLATPPCQRLRRKHSVVHYQSELLLSCGRIALPLLLTEGRGGYHCASRNHILYTIPKFTERSARTNHANMFNPAEMRADSTVVLSAAEARTSLTSTAPVLHGPPSGRAGSSGVGDQLSTVFPSNTIE